MPLDKSEGSVKDHYGNREARRTSLTLVAARLTLHGICSLFGNERNHNERSDRISPPPSERCVKHQTNQQNAREVKAEVSLFGIGMAELLSSLATFFFARDRRGITTSDTQARLIPGMLCSGVFLVTRSEMDS